MKRSLRILCVLLFTLLYSASRAQCPIGYTSCSANWDFLDFFPSAGNGSYTNLSQSQTQRFTFGTQHFTIVHNYTGSNAAGENATHTGETGSYGSGEDVQFLGNGTVSISFKNEVTNLKFSLYDIDYNQRVVVSALNVATPLNLTMAAVSGTNLTIAGSGGTAPSATAGATNAIADNSSDGTVNIDIAGPVTSITITITQTDTKTTGPAAGREDGSFWISDMGACSVGSFATGYFQVARPFTGQPGYVLAVRNDSIYYVNPATGRAKFIFADLGHTNINSLAYDPVNHYFYYVYSLSGSGGSTNPNNKVLRRYDYNMDTMGIVVNDVSTFLGIPTFDVGVESGAAAFYDGSLYLGIEASSSSSYEAIVWKVDFNGTTAPAFASQVYGITGSGHDWADIGVSNGVLYDFDGASSNTDIYQVNLLSRSVTQYAPGGGWIPRQVAIDWNDQVYHLGQPSSGSTGTVSPYLYNGNINSGQLQTIAFNGVNVTGSWGDAAEAFKPKADFGDAPASFDPDPMSPALHEVDQNLRLGASSDIEFDKTSSASCTADGTDEDGLPYVRILTNSGNYFTEVEVFNNSGADATVCAWVDFNDNGIFEAGEGISQTVATSASMQTINLFWPSVTTSLVNNSYTFLRVRISSAANGMTAANPTGFFDNGEVEDYYVVINFSPLTMALADFNAQKISEDKTTITWTANEEEAGTVYEVQRSADGRNWITIHEVVASQDLNKASYAFHDLSPVKPFSYYRLKYTDIRDRQQFSDVKKLQFRLLRSISVFPNPAITSSGLRIESIIAGTGTVMVSDAYGKLVYKEKVELRKGTTMIPLPFVRMLSSGAYTVSLAFQEDQITQKLIVNKR